MEHAQTHEAHAKKKSLIASEQLRPDVAAARDSFFAEKLKDMPLNDVVVLDESYATTVFTRLRGRCPRNCRLTARVPGGHWKRLTILAAITVAGVLCGSTIEASTDSDVFRSFVDHVLVPGLRPGMVVVMDKRRRGTRTVRDLAGVTRARFYSCAVRVCR